MSALFLSADFKNRIINIFGDRGQKWLSDLPNLIEYCREKWYITFLDPYPLSYNFVCRAVYNNQPVVIKICVPGKQVKDEIAVFENYSGQNFCRLLASEAEKGIMILERLEPGYLLSSVNNEAEATRIAARLIRQMEKKTTNFNGDFQSPASHFRQLRSLRSLFNGGTGSIPAEFVEQAERLVPDLLSTINCPRLLHGDFHQYNILASGADWKLIDPKGIIGDSVYEIIPFLVNHLEGKNIQTTIEQRIRIFSDELELNKQNMVRWALCRTILSLWWKIEDKEEVSGTDLEVCGLFYRWNKESTY
jgi:streptomycin 6-kinase